MTDERRAAEAGDEADTADLDPHAERLPHGSAVPAPLDVDDSDTDQDTTDGAPLAEAAGVAPSVAAAELDTLDDGSEDEAPQEREEPSVVPSSSVVPAADLGDDETASPLPHVELAPERAGRRVAPGVRIATRLAAAAVAATLLPAGIAAAGLVLVPAEAPAPSAPEIPKALPDELLAAERAFDAMEAELRALDTQRVALEQKALEDALATATPKLMQRVAEARDARRSAGATGDALKAPFTFDELAPALERLGVTEGGARFVIGRDGGVIAPKGASLPTGVELAAPGEDVAALAVVVPRKGGRALVARRCVAKEPLCLVEERPLPPLPTAGNVTRGSLGKARATLTSLVAPAAPEVAEVEQPLDSGRLRLLLAGGAVALALLLGILLARRLHVLLATPLTTLEGRLRLLAAGRVSERAPLPRPAEIEALEDAVDALAETLGQLERLEDEDAQRARRLFALADVVGEAARGQLFLRAPPADDVAEAALHDALNQLLEAFERQVVRMKSHLLVLARDAEADDDMGVAPSVSKGEEGRVQALQRRIHGLRPVATLLADVAQRLASLAKLPAGETRVPGELARLAEAIGQRAKTAHGLFDALEAEAARLSDGATPGGRGLAPEQRRALEQLARDLAALAVDETLPTLVESLRGLDEDDIASRLATQG